jgi:hypothetical protein
MNIYVSKRALFLLHQESIKMKKIRVGKLMTNEPSSEKHSNKVRIIDAICINCNKRFTSMRSVSMHLKTTGARHVVNFIFSMEITIRKQDLGIGAVLN